GPAATAVERADAARAARRSERREAGPAAAHRSRGPRAARCACPARPEQLADGTERVVRGASGPHELPQRVSDGRGEVDRELGALARVTDPVDEPVEEERPRAVESREHEPLDPSRGGCLLVAARAVGP